MINQKTNNKVFFIIITIRQTTQTHKHKVKHNNTKSKTKSSQTLQTPLLPPSVPRHERNGTKRPIIL